MGTLDVLQPLSSIHDFSIFVFPQSKIIPDLCVWYSLRCFLIHDRCSALSLARSSSANSLPLPPLCLGIWSNFTTRPLARLFNLLRHSKISSTVMPYTQSMRLFSFIASCVVVTIPDFSSITVAEQVRGTVISLYFPPPISASYLFLDTFVYQISPLPGNILYRYLRLHCWGH